jgi:eukaryotic-like serine/threonine-protein kinase
MWTESAGSRVGELISEKYQILKLLGAGGMGAVYEAKHVFLGRRFGLKFLHPSLAEHPEMLARFRSEAKAAGGLECENLVAVTDFGVASDGSPYLVMEYLEGEDLGGLLDRVGTLPVVRAVRILIQACRGVAAAHRAEIIHRDLKPQNLFIARRGDGSDLVKVLDFGIAKLRTATDHGAHLTRTGTTMGTPHYMSPEQARSAGDVDARADIFALGVILYQALSGKQPHPGDSYNNIIVHLLTEPPVPLDSVVSGIPARLSEIVHRAIASDMYARFASVDELVSALEPYSAPTTGSEAPVGGTLLTPLSQRELEGPARRAQNATFGTRDTEAKAALSVSRPALTRLEAGAKRAAYAKRSAIGILLVVGVGLAAVGVRSSLRELSNSAPGLSASAALPSTTPESVRTNPSTAPAPELAQANTDPKPNDSQADHAKATFAQDAHASPALSGPSAPAPIASARAAARIDLAPASKPTRPAPVLSASSALAKAESGWRSVLVRDVPFDGGSKTTGQHGAAGGHP